MWPWNKKKVNRDYHTEPDKEFSVNGPALVANLSNLCDYCINFNPDIEDCGLERLYSVKEYRNVHHITVTTQRKVPMCAYFSIEVKK